MALIRGKQIGAGEIDTRELADDSVTNDKIGLLAVDTAEIAVGAVTEGKLDSALEASLIRTDGSEDFGANQSMGGSFKITNMVDPSDAQDAATKAYVDALSSGLDPKESCRVATVAALPAFTASGSGVGKILTADSVGILTVDGIATLLGDRILVKDEGASDVDHGIYEVTTEGTAGVAFILTRATDHDEDAEMTAGNFTFIEEGTTQDNAGFVLTTNDTITVDTTATAWTQFSGAGQIIAGAGLTKSVNTLDVGGGDGINVLADTVEVDLLSGGGLKFTTGELGIEPADFAGTNLEDDGSDNLRIAASAAGGGLTGGGAAVLAVGAGNAITVNADDVAVNPAGLIQGGAAEIDGDLIDIDYVESNYTPATTGIATDINQLAAHLEGIDDELGTLGGAGTPAQESVTTEVITGTDTSLADTLNSTPTSDASVAIYLNGVLQKQGAGFDYDIVTNTTIRWLASSGTAVDMDTSDVLIAIYES